jgi:peptidoglycan hydrolase-like protein with peptidoglycan-binding domain
MQSGRQDLKLGSLGEDVKLLQEQLRQLGFTIEDAEGLFDKSTHEAVVEFQKQHRLRSTGLVDSETAIRIAEALLGMRAKDITSDRQDPSPKKRVVLGNVKYASGEPVTGVAASERSLP